VFSFSFQFTGCAFFYISFDSGIIPIAFWGQSHNALKCSWNWAYRSVLHLQYILSVSESAWFSSIDINTESMLPPPPPKLVCVLAANLKVALATAIYRKGGWGIMTRLCGLRHLTYTTEHVLTIHTRLYLYSICNISPISMTRRIPRRVVGGCCVSESSFQQK
jgi:hypothetical protein